MMYSDEIENVRQDATLVLADPAFVESINNDKEG
jgi:hypothetical protein